MLNLSADWLSIFLPHVQKVNRLSAAHVLMIPSLTVASPNPTLLGAKTKTNSRGFDIDISMTGNLINRNETCCVVFVSGRFGNSKCQMQSADV